jgi:predicted Zn-dependent protease
MVVFLALYMALKHVNKSLAAIAALIAIASEVTAPAVNSSPQSLNAALILLSNQYAAATADAQRLAFATAAESLIATTNGAIGTARRSAVRCSLAATAAEHGAALESRFSDSGP